jgi:hypothetical protein
LIRTLVHIALYGLGIKLLCLMVKQATWQMSQGEGWTALQWGIVVTLSFIGWYVVQEWVRTR